MQKSSRAGTAIPARFGPQRDRVLRILARWEAAVWSARAGENMPTIDRLPVQLAGMR